MKFSLQKFTYLYIVKNSNFTYLYIRPPSEKIEPPYNEKIVVAFSIFLVKYAITEKIELSNRKK